MIVFFSPCNLLPTFQNTEISHKNWGSWLLLKKKKIWQHWAYMPSCQQLSWSWILTSLDPVLCSSCHSLVLASIWVCDPYCSGLIRLFSKSYVITFLLILLLKHAIWLWHLSASSVSSVLAASRVFYFGMSSMVLVQCLTYCKEVSAYLYTSALVWPGNWGSPICCGF